MVDEDTKAQGLSNLSKFTELAMAGVAGGGSVLNLDSLTLEPIHLPFRYTENLMGCKRTNNIPAGILDNALESKVMSRFAQERHEKDFRRDKRGRQMPRGKFTLQLSETSGKTQKEENVGGRSQQSKGLLNKDIVAPTPEMMLHMAPTIAPECQ